MTTQLNPPVTFSQLMQRTWFWLLVGGLATFTIGFILIQATAYDWFPRWKTLPPLPNRETPRRFNEVRVRDSIDVVTDRGNFYRCRLLVPNNCWIPIPREGMQGIPHDQSGELPAPRPHPDALDVSLFYRDHDYEYEVFMVDILRDGRVNILDQRITNIFNHPIVRLICTIFFLFPGLLVGLIIDALVNRPRK